MSEHEPNTGKSRIELYRPRRIESDPSRLLPEVGLFGTCGSPESTWRRDIFIPELERRGLNYFNPQVGGGLWTPEMAQQEAEQMAKDSIIVLPISNETHGYASLAEAGWAMLGALLRGQEVGIFVQESEGMPKDAQRARSLFLALATDLRRNYPVFTFENSMEDLAAWAAIKMKGRADLQGSKLRQKIVSELQKIEASDVVSIFGTTAPSTTWREEMKRALSDAGITFFDPYKENWTNADLQAESQHKLNDKVLLQIISEESESFGSLAESGLIALSAFVRGQAYGIYIEDHPSSSASDTNRTRALVRAHIGKLNEQFPGVVFLARTKEELVQFAVEVMRKPSS